MKKWINENKLMTAVIAFILVALGIAAYEFLFTKDCQECVTGWTVLKQEGWNFWGWALGLTALSGVATYFIVKKVKGDGGYGNISMLIPILILLTIAFGKGCTDKANNAVTTEKGNPNPQKADSLRIPAEDLLPKK